MKIFNLYGDDWGETRDRDGWRIKEALSATTSARADWREHVRGRTR